MPNSDTLSPLDVVVVTEGTMAASTSEYAQQRIAAATASLPARVGSARVRLTRHVDGSPAPVTAQVNLDIGGRLALDLEGTTVWAPAPVRPTVAVSTIRKRLQSAVVVAATAAPAGGLKKPLTTA